MTIHSSLLEPSAIHPAAYVNAIDPGGVGARKMWVDTSRGTGAYLLKLRSDDNTSWITLAYTGPAAFPFDNTGATDIGPAFKTWLTSHKGEFGGVNYLPTGKYTIGALASRVSVGDGYDYLTLKGDGLGTCISHSVDGATDTDPALISIIGSAPYSLKRISLDNFRVKGNSLNDYARLIAVDNVDEFEGNRIYLENNAVEGLVSYGGSGNMRSAILRGCRSKNIGGVTGRSAWNLNADTVVFTDFIVDGGGGAFESNSSYTVIGTGICQNTNYGFLVLSTYATYMNGAFQFITNYGANLSNVYCRQINSHALHFADYKGQPNPNYPAHGTVNNPGSGGRACVTNWTFDQCANVAWGGCDLSEVIEFNGGLVTGQINLGFGPQTPAFSPNNGRWHIHDMTFERGNGERFSSLMGPYISGYLATSNVRLVRNLIRDNCWGFNEAFVVSIDSMAQDNQWEDVDGYLAANPTTGLYRFQNTATVALASLKFQDFDAKSAHTISMFAEQTKLVLKSATIPPFMTFKPGDLLTSNYAGATWTFMRCLTGGTNNPTPLSGITGTGTIGTNTITLNSTTGIVQYCWITCSGVAAKQVTAINGLVLTLGANLEASPSAAAISYASPTWATL